VPTRVEQSYSKEVQLLPTYCEQRVTYLFIGISDLELESTFLEHCGMLLLEGDDAHANCGVCPPDETNPGAGVAAMKYQDQVHYLPFPGSKRCRCGAELRTVNGAISEIFRKSGLRFTEIFTRCRTAHIFLVTTIAPL
jgi:hypothetical protein